MLVCCGEEEISLVTPCLYFVILYVSVANAIIHRFFFKLLVNVFHITLKYCKKICKCIYLNFLLI